MKVYISIFCCVFLFRTCFAEEYQDHSLLSKRIEAHMRQHIPDYQQRDIRINVERIDPRLKLKSCKDKDLQVFNPYATTLANTNTMGIRCTAANKSWTLYVPVNLAWFKPVVVSTKTILRGEPLHTNALSLDKRNIRTLKQGYFSEPKQLSGLIARRNIPAGEVITPNTLKKETVIKRGQLVNIVAKNPQFTVQMKGEALHDGQLGDVIKVRNSSSKRIIHAKVTGGQHVEVTV